MVKLRVNTVKNYSISVFLFLCAISSYVFKSNIYLLPAFFIFLNFYKKSFYLFFIASLFSFVVAYHGFFEQFVFLFYIFILIYGSDYFKNNYDILLKVFSYLLLAFYFICLFFPQKYTDISSVLTLRSRLWPIVLENEINPNFIGMTAFIASSYFYHKEKYFYFFVSSFFIILSQSRSAFIILIIYTVMVKPLGLKRSLGLFLSIPLFFYIFNKSSISERFNESGLNGRDEIFLNYFNSISVNFPFPGEKYNINIYGPLDNLYLKSLYEYGIAGILLIAIPVFYIFSLKKWKNWPVFVFIISFFILGLVESSYINNAVVLIAFSSVLKAKNP